MTYCLARVAAIVILLLLAVSPQTFAQDVGSDVLSSMGFIPTSTKRAPDFSLIDLYGNPTGTASFNGKMTLLNFWATWCAPCRNEMPSLERLYQKFAARSNFQIIAVDMQESRGTVSSFLKSNGYHFSVVLDPTGEAASRYSVQDIPLTFIIDGEGNILGYRSGNTDWTSPAVLRGIATLLGG